MTTGCTCERRQTAAVWPRTHATVFTAATIGLSMLLGPRAEVLRGESVARDLAEIRVHVVAGHFAHAALGIDVLDPLLAWQVLASPHDAHDARIADRHPAFLAALSGEMEHEIVARDLDVSVADRGEAVVPMGLGILVVADAEQRRVEQAHHRREHTLARELRAREVGADAGTQLRQRLAEVQGLLELP